MTLGRCPLSIFCSRGTPPNPESITLFHSVRGQHMRRPLHQGVPQMWRGQLKPGFLNSVPGGFFAGRDQDVIAGRDQDVIARKTFDHPLFCSHIPQHGPVYGGV